MRSIIWQPTLWRPATFWSLTATLALVGSQLAAQGLPPAPPGLIAAPSLPADLRSSSEDPFIDDVPIPIAEDEFEQAERIPAPNSSEIPDDPDAASPFDHGLETQYETGGGCSQCQCETCCCDDATEQTFFFPQYWPIKLRGWLNGGYMGNMQNPPSRFHGPYNAVDRNEIMGSQAYLIAEANLPADDSFGFGARVDVLYGEDYLLAQSVGMEVRSDGTPRWNTNEFYGLALPQLYGQVGTNNFNLKLGHFYSIVGYEGIQAPDNFFYSKSYSYQFAGPFTHWGGLLSWKPTERLEVQGGLTNGWNTLDRSSDRLGYLLGVKFTHESFWVSLAATTGDEFNNVAGRPGLAPDYANRTRYSAIVGLQLTEKLEWVVHHWYGFQQNGVPGGVNADWWGIDQYIYYTINDQWKAAVRLEWFHDQDGTRLGLNRPSNPNKPPFGGQVYSASLGVNWTPHPNFILRPEVRSDWYDPNFGGLPYDDGTKSHQFLIGMDGIVKF